MTPREKLAYIAERVPGADFGHDPFPSLVVGDGYSIYFKDDAWEDNGGVVLLMERFGIELIPHRDKESRQIMGWSASVDGYHEVDAEYVTPAVIDCTVALLGATEGAG